jgi:hypothetical protein
MKDSLSSTKKQEQKEQNTRQILLRGLEQLSAAFLLQLFSLCFFTCARQHY